MRRGSDQVGVKWGGSTEDLGMILFGERGVEVGGMDGVGEKCLEGRQKTDWEGSLPRYV